MVNKLLFFVLLMAGASCNVNLKPNDMEWLDVYNEGDTLIFKSEAGELDTSYITWKDVFHPEYNPFSHDWRHTPVMGVVKYYNKNLQYNDGIDKLVYLIKMHPDSATLLHISYKYSHFHTKVTAGNKELQKLKNGKVYEFDVYHRLAGPEKPRVLYWHEAYGVIKYITHGGITWERINLVEDK